LAARVLQVDPVAPAPAVIAEAAAVLRAGGLVAFPTETVYGLGGNAIDDAAVARIFAAKGRDPSDPVIVHLADRRDLGDLVRELPAPAQLLAARFWPGPLPLVLPRAERVPPRVSAGLPTVAVRVPSHPVARALIAAAGVPVAAPSANLFGRTSPTTAAHVLADLGDRIDVVLDGGPTPAGVESTVVAFEGEEVVVLRPGATPVEELSRCLAEAGFRPPRLVERGPQAGSPGLLARHYAPRVPLVLLRGPERERLQWLRAALAARPDRRIGLLLSDEELRALSPLAPEHRARPLGPRSHPEVAARRLFAAMRELEAEGVELIYATDPDPAGLGLAVADRLRRAAEEVVEVGRTQEGS